MAKKPSKEETALTVRTDVEEGIPMEISNVQIPLGSLVGGGSAHALLRVSPQAQGILAEPVKDEEIDILPTGEVYLSQVGYRRRLLAAFGAGGWKLVPIGDPLSMRDGVPALVQRFELWVGGHCVGTAYGEADYHADNPRTTWATAWESAKSNALMRLCKDLGIATECWDRRWTEAFKQRRCVRVWRKSEQKPQWRLLDAAPWYDESGAVKDSPNAAAWKGPGEGAPSQEDHPIEGARVVPTQVEKNGVAANGMPSGNGEQKRPARPISEGQLKRLFAILRSKADELKLDRHDFRDLVKEHLSVHYHLDSAEQILMSQYDAIISWIQKYTPREPGDDDAA